MKMADLAKLNETGRLRRKTFEYSTENKQSKPGLRMGRLINEHANAESEDTGTESCYNDCFEFIQSVFKRADIDFGIMPSYQQLNDLAKSIIVYLQSGQVDIMGLFMKHREGDYLHSHSVNVAFLSTMIGVWLNYNMSELNKLTIAALFHDIGMLRFRDIALQPKKIDQFEREKINRHPALSAQFLEQIPGIDMRLPETVCLHHKRLDKNGNSISSHAQIIGLVDMLEAMIHPRPYKCTMAPHVAVQCILDNMTGCFEGSIIKTLVDNIGIYPPGTWVRLDTKQIGLVIDINRGSPLSPKLNIIFDDQMKQLSHPKTLDLSKQTNIHVKEPLSEEDRNRVRDILS